MITFLTPSSFAFEIAAESPRALKEPVGLLLSSFTYKFDSPRALPSLGRSNRAVSPSPSETIFCSSNTGKNSCQRHIPFGRLWTSSLYTRSRAAFRSYVTRMGAWQSGQNVCISLSENDFPQSEHCKPWI